MINRTEQLFIAKRYRIIVSGVYLYDHSRGSTVSKLVSLIGHKWIVS